MLQGQRMIYSCMLYMDKADSHAQNTHARTYIYTVCLPPDMANGGESSCKRPMPDKLVEA